MTDAIGSAQPATAAPSAPPAPAPAQPSGGRTAVESLYAPGKAPARGSDAYTFGVMAAARVDFGHMTAEQARAELAAQAAPDGAIDAPQAAPSSDGETAAASPVEAVRESIELSNALGELANVSPELLHPAAVSAYANRLCAGLENPPTTAAKQQAAAEGMASLERAFPGKGDKIAADARAELAILAQCMPKLPLWLERSGLGNDLEIIQRLAKAHQARQIAQFGGRT